LGVTKSSVLADAGEDLRLAAVLKKDPAYSVPLVSVTLLNPGARGSEVTSDPLRCTYEHPHFTL
jgi:hypothetical protein